MSTKISFCLWLKRALPWCSALPAALCLAAVPMWETGELSYPSGEAEVSAFVNSIDDTQLQLVLCAKDSGYARRLTLLLPQSVPDAVLRLELKADDLQITLYGELSGNSLELRLEEELLLKLSHSQTLSLIFTPEWAARLGIPAVLDIPMTGADLVMREVASECTALCLQRGYQCERKLVSSLLWPADHFEAYNVPHADIDALCTRDSGGERYVFTNSPGCKVALDRFYLGHGVGPLSFLFELFSRREGPFYAYEEGWNKTVDLAPSGPLKEQLYARDQEWYLLLYALSGTRDVAEFPGSFYKIRNSETPSGPYIYDQEQLCELELLKYQAVLQTRLKGVPQTLKQYDETLKHWGSFYRELVEILPQDNQIQALRPVIFRAMLERLWKLSGLPKKPSFDLRQRFEQGHGGHTVSGAPLEELCAVFEGSGAQEYFHASKDCILAIHSGLRSRGLTNMAGFTELQDRWQDFSQAWQRSVFAPAPVTEHEAEESLPSASAEEDKFAPTPSALQLPLLSLYRIYGYGQYLQQRQCLMSRDNDICAFETQRALQQYETALENCLNSLGAVSAADRGTLTELDRGWRAYYAALERYTAELEGAGQTQQWRAQFVLGLAAVLQTQVLLNLNYYREELPSAEELSAPPETR